MKNMKSLLAAVMGILALNGFSSLAAAETPTIHIENADGATVKIEADGTKIIKGQDGTTIQVKPDGTKSIQEADGTTIEIKPDGSKSIKKADGTTIQVPAK